MKLTKIVCTLGPACNNPDGVRKLADAGMAVARFNFSHGNHETHLGNKKLIDDLNENGYSVATMMDTKGPEIRTGDVDAPIVVKAGQEVAFTHANDKTFDGPVIKVNYPDFDKDVKDATCILLDNGEIIFDLVKSEKDWVIAKSQDDGSIGSRRHVNLPGSHVSLPSVTEKDWTDIEMGCKEGFDFVALSFIRTGDEVREVKKFIEKKKSHMQIIAKIENAVAVEHIDDIIDASDAIMIARGDLGAELPPEKIPALQDDMVERCRMKGKPVIVATQMLESMIKNPLPTRAEVTDVAHAATSGADSTMLSGETAAGKYPYRSLEIMARILEETEARQPPTFLMEEDIFNTRHEAFANAAVTMALSLEAKAIITFTKSGTTPRAVSHLRPSVPIIAITDTPEMQRSLMLCYSVIPFAMEFKKDPGDMIDSVLETIRDKKILASGDTVVLITAMIDKGHVVNTVQNRVIS